MKKIKSILAISFMLLVQTAMAQTVALPDTNLRNVLKSRYPGVMQGNELNIADAAAFNGTLDLSNSNIYDATGIQYFTGIVTLILSNNHLETLPDISGTSGLRNFYASDNNLVSMPDMSSFTTITDFQVMRNKLTQLPDLTNCTNLRSLYISSNFITKIPDLTKFPNLTNLVIGDNPLDQPIDFSPCPNLQDLHIHKTNADTIIGLEVLTKLKTLFAWGNNIKDLSGLDNNTTLETFVVFSNDLKTLPNFTNKPGLIQLDINSNDLTFEDIIPIVKQYPSASFKYSPQHTLHVFDDVNARVESSISFTYPENSPEPGNIYVWTKDGSVIDSSASPTFNINPVSYSDSGQYFLKVYNSYLPNMTLRTDTFQLKVNACLDLSIPFVDVIEKDCSKGYTIDLSGAEISGGTAPFTYKLSNGFFKGTFDSEIIENIPAGMFTITLIDSKACEATDNFVLNRIENCEPIITPNGDGVADTYYIDKQGHVEIYDLRRKLIKSFDAPATWDGTDQNGSLLDTGYYIVILNGETPIYVTLIR